MAKRRFSFWESYYSAMMLLPDDASRGRFVTAICARVFEGVEPDFGDDRTLGVAFTIVADQVEESMGLFERASEGGKKSAQKRKSKSAPESNSKGVGEGGSARGLPKGVDQGCPQRKVRYSKVPYDADGAPTESRRRDTLTEEQMAALSRLGESQTDLPPQC